MRQRCWAPAPSPALLMRAPCATFACARRRWSGAPHRNSPRTRSAAGSGTGAPGCAQTASPSAACTRRTPTPATKRRNRRHARYKEPTDKNKLLCSINRNQSIIDPVTRIPPTKTNYCVQLSGINPLLIVSSYSGPILVLDNQAVVATPELPIVHTCRSRRTKRARSPDDYYDAALCCC
eukprot:1192491-Prorocentrum_minimum.AAC.6